MAARAAVFQRVQLGLETVKGTEVAANRQLSCTSFRPRARIPGDPFRAVGDKFPSDITIGKEWSEWEIDGVLAYNDFAYLMASLLVKPAGTYTFKPANSAADDIQTFSLQHGSAAQAEKAAYGFVNSLSVEFASRGVMQVRGSMLARTLTTGATLTATPTRVAPRIVSPRSLDVYVADSIAGLAAGKLTAAFGYGFNIANRHGTKMVMDSTQTSFTEHVERAPDFSAHLNIENDAYSAGLMADVRTAKQKFFRIKSTGVEYGVGTPYILQITHPFKLREPSPQDTDDVDAYNWDMMPDYESGFDSGIEVVITTDMGSL